MILEPTPLAGLFVVRPEPIRDERGFFARVWSVDEFATAGVAFSPVQSSISASNRAGTMRGMHWQASPHEETKLVRVTQGAVFDVAVDLRAGSPTQARWFGLELSAANRLALLIPPGFAHGLVTLKDDTEVLYAMDTPYAAAFARGARHDDPAFGIAWPRDITVIGQRDRDWPDWTGSA